jgi:hypothetical protein
MACTTSVKNVRQFLGFANFYRKFVEHFADIAKPLNALTRKDLPFKWTAAEQTAFDNLKRKFETAPVIQIPDPDAPFVIEADASKHALGAVLKQQDLNGDWHPCGYYSSSLTETERNYTVGDRELMAIIRALDNWRHYLMGSPHPIVIYSDHKNLLYFKKPQKLNRRQARWSLLLSQYDLELKHLPGEKNTQADALSCRPDHIPEKDTDNEDVTLLPEKLFINLIDVDLRDHILRIHDKDEPVKNALEALKTGGELPLKTA